MEPKVTTVRATTAGKEIEFETGKLALLAGGAVTARMGESIIFAAATMSDSIREDADFFPLSVEYEEKMYAGGRIPGSFFRREGRPSTEAILIARLTDRPIRPIFDKYMRNEVQILTSSISADNEHPLDLLVVNAASAALMVSDIPWEGPIGAVRVGLINGELVVNPTYEEMERSDLDLRIAGTHDAILMVECGANEVPEETVIRALELGHRSIQPILDAQIELAKAAGKTKREATIIAADEGLVEELMHRYGQAAYDALEANRSKADVNTAIKELGEKVASDYAVEDAEAHVDIRPAYDAVIKKITRKRILEEGKRPDGRGLSDIRPIWGEVGTSPRAHGSGLFTRGETQVLTLTTLGTPKEAQELDNLSPLDSKRYMHHYNFPPYSTGEVSRLRGTSRRETGHGALAERALVPVIPPESEFPYTLRLVSEVMASNGSSSMASVCGSTLSLMDAGVPIKAPVAGVAMGLIKQDDAYAILTDIQGIEDHLGDMDFKVAGTEKGITALQMDIKIKGITTEIMSKALAQARDARMFIMGKLLEIIPTYRPQLKPHTPRIITIKVPVEKIGAVIGPGGKMIRSIQEQTHTKIDIEEDGTVYISATDGVAENQAREMVLGLIEVPQLGRIYTGKVVRIADFGAFVEILPNVDGMVHISQLDSERVEKVEDLFSLGDEMTVMVTGIDENGKIRLSRQAVLEGWTLEEAAEKDARGGRKPSGGSRDRNDRGGDRRGGDRDRKPFRRRD